MCAIFVSVTIPITQQWLIVCWWRHEHQIKIQIFGDHIIPSNRQILSKSYDQHQHTPIMKSISTWLKCWKILCCPTKCGCRTIAMCVVLVKNCEINFWVAIWKDITYANWFVQEEVVTEPSGSSNICMRRWTAAKKLWSEIGLLRTPTPCLREQKAF